MSLWLWTVVPLVLLHVVWARCSPDGLRFQLLLDVVLAAVVGPALVSGNDLNPVRCVQNLPPFRSVEWSQRTAFQRTQSDVVFQFHPWWEEAGRQLLRGQTPQIQPAVGAGLPLLANGQTGLMAPVMAPVWLLGPERGTTVMAFWKLELAGIGAFLLMLRAWRLSTTAARVAGVAWAGSPYLVGWLLVPLAWVVAFLPWAWWLMWRVMRGRAGPRDAVAAGIIFGWVMGSGLHPETGAIVCGSALLMALMTRPRRWRRPVAVAALSGLVAVVLSWPTIGLISASSRHELGGEGAANRDRPPWSLQRDLVRQIIVPAAMGHPARGDWQAAYPHAPGAAGVGGAVLALLAVAGYRRRYRRLALAALSASVIGLVLLVRIPPLDCLLVRIPPLDQMTLARFGVLIPWGLVVLAALGLDGARRERWRAPIARLVPALMIVAVALWSAPWRLAPFDTGLVIVTCTLAVVVALFRWRTVIPFLVAGELGLLALAVNPVAAKEDRLPRPEILNRLAELEAQRPCRIVGLGLALPANLASRYGLSDLRASDPLRPVPFARLMGVLGEPRTVLGGPLTDLPPGLCGAWGVGFAMTGPKRSLPGWRKIWASSDGTIWENPELLPEVRVVGSAVAQPSGREGLHDVLSGLDFGTTALVSHGASLVAASETKVEIGVRSPTRLKATVECDGACLLVIAQPWAPGWKARVEGESADIVLANVAGMAVPVPSGRHQVELTYHPWRWWPRRGWPTK